MPAGTSGERFPRRRLAPGYRVPDVDSFIDRIEATLTGSARPDQRLTSMDVRTVKFRITRYRGYDDRAVDDALDTYAQRLDDAGNAP